MKLHPLALLAAMATLAIAPTASANIPVVTAATYCAEGAPAISWNVTMSNYTLYGTPTTDENYNVNVELSLDGGPWMLYQVGEVTFLNNHTFSGSATLPLGTLSARVRVIALGAWTSGRIVEVYEYATLSMTEAGAEVFELPQDCEPPPPPPPTNPGTGTPGYWKNHPEAWPVSSLVIGGVTYTQAELLGFLGGSTSRDVTRIMARAVIAAELNGLIGNDTSCIDAVLDDANAWLVVNPIGSGLKGSSDAWAVGGPIATTLDDYNNGLICAPHRG